MASVVEDMAVQALHGMDGTDVTGKGNAGRTVIC